MSVGHLKIICLSVVMVLMGCSDALSPAEVELLNSIEGYWALADDSAATGLCIEVALDTPPEVCPCPTGGGEIVSLSSLPRVPFKPIVKRAVV